VAKRFYSETELDALCAEEGPMQPLAYTLRSPMPQVLLVTADPRLGEGGLAVRTTTMTPVSWNPYTKAISIPLDDIKVVRALRQPDARCVLALPSRKLLRQLTICSNKLPLGISEAAVARFKLHKSLFVDVPSIEDCPVNFECVVAHLEEYHGHLVAFLRVVGASIDDAMLFLERAEIVAIYPTNYADEVVREDGSVRTRVSLLSDLFLRPTFPVAHKRGWYGTFEVWMKDLYDEEYLNLDEYNRAIAWHARWQEVFADLDAPDRARLRADLTNLIRLIAHQRWEELHAFLAGVQAA